MKNKEEREVTRNWYLYEVGKNYNNMQNLYEDGKENFNYYHGRQWEGLKKPSSASEPIVLNIIKPIIKYKVNVVNQNSYQLVFNPNTYNTQEELQQLKDVTKGLTQFVNRMWEKSQSGKIVRNIVKNACINSEGIIHFFNEEENIFSEEIDKNNIYYGNENESNIQKQPYILIAYRKTVEEVRELTRKNKENGLTTASNEDIETIVSDMDYMEQPGSEKRTVEVTPMCLVIRKYEKKKDGKIWVSESTKYCSIVDEQNTECELYPFAHYVWEEERGYSRDYPHVGQMGRCFVLEERVLWKYRQSSSKYRALRNRSDLY